MLCCALYYDPTVNRYLTEQTFMPLLSISVLPKIKKKILMTGFEVKFAQFVSQVPNMNLCTYSPINPDEAFPVLRHHK